MNIIKKRNKIKIEGFTLIEIIIALGIFVILLSIAIGGFVDALRGQRVAVGLMEINDNMGLILEQMAREIRLGYNFSVPVQGELQFQKSGSKFISYNLSGNSINRKEADSFPNLNLAPNNQITAKNIKIDKFNIIACGENIDFINYPLFDCGGGGTFQPRITLSIRITGKNEDSYIEKIGAYNEIQTTISSRQYTVQ